jgi:hypothetical protein
MSMDFRSSLPVIVTFSFSLARPQSVLPADVFFLTRSTQKIQL